MVRRSYRSAKKRFLNNDRQMSHESIDWILCKKKVIRNRKKENDRKLNWLQKKTRNSIFYKVRCSFSQNEAHIPQWYCCSKRYCAAFCDRPPPLLCLRHDEYYEDEINEWPDWARGLILMYTALFLTILEDVGPYRSSYRSEDTGIDIDVDVGDPSKCRVY